MCVFVLLSLCVCVCVRRMCCALSTVCLFRALSATASACPHRLQQPRLLIALQYFFILCLCLCVSCPVSYDQFNVLIVIFCLTIFFHSLLVLMRLLSRLL